MKNLPIIGLIVFAVILAGAFAGWAVGRRLPAHHTTDDTKSLVSLSMAVVGTASALVLGLLISNANSSFMTRNGEVIALSSYIIRLDRMLRYYGPAADPARETLRHYAERKTADLFPESPGDRIRIDEESTYELLLRVEDLMLALHPADPGQQWALGQAMMLAAQIGNTRWLLAQQRGQGTPTLLLGLVVWWLTLLFASFGLFAPRNLTSVLMLTLCALSISSAFEIIIQLERPFAGIIHISPRPLHNAIHALTR
jgi:hypothetical protein